MKNNDFQIVSCETNLRWLAGEPPSEERTRQTQKMVDEIKRLTEESLSNEGANDNENHQR